MTTEALAETIHRGEEYVERLKREGKPVDRSLAYLDRLKAMLCDSARFSANRQETDSSWRKGLAETKYNNDTDLGEEEGLSAKLSTPRRAELGGKADSGGSIVRERTTDRDGRTLAVRWVSGIIGDMWVTFDRATALRCGLARPGGPPVFYLATDHVEFFKAATPEHLQRVAEFKKAFLSPEIPQ